MNVVTIEEKNCVTKKARNCWNDVQYIGLMAYGFLAINRYLLFGGKRSFQYDGEPCTGNIILHVKEGRLRNTQASARIKSFFKRNVLPTLAEIFPQIDQDYTGDIELHYTEGFLTVFKMAH